MRFELLLAIAAMSMALLSGAARATADGPDFYRVSGVAAGDVLNIRAEPEPHAPKVGEIPPTAPAYATSAARAD